MLKPGDRLGPYVLQEKLGQGGMGVVHRAVDASGRTIALKVLPLESSGDARFVARFLREGAVAARLDHPNLVRCLGTGQQDGLLFMALELVEGGTLKERGIQRWREAARLGAQVARGLEAMHDRGLVHRDLKPANVLVDSQGRARIADLGLVRDARAETLTRTGEFLGTAEYVAPEQTEGGREAGPPADLYALGCTLHAMLAGHPPFPGSGAEVLTKHLNAAPPPIRRFVADVPEELEQLVLRLLAKDPRARGTAGCVAERLEALAAPGAPRRSRAPVVLAAVAGLVLVGAAGGALQAIPSWPQAPPVAPTLPPPPRDTRPAWFLALPEAQRPRLPGGIRIAETAGEYLNELDGSVLVFVPGGTTWLGDDDGSERESPRHEVVLSPFLIGKHEVTRSQFETFLERARPRYVPRSMTATDPGEQAHDFAPNKLDDAHAGGVALNDALAMDQSWKDPSRVPATGDPDRNPVTVVHPVDVLRYVAWAKLELPTEAQWERTGVGPGATRADRKLYPWPGGTRTDPGRKANLADASLFRTFPEGGWLPGSCFVGYDDGTAGTAAVGSFPDDVTPEGAYDLLGNVREICRDRYSSSGPRDRGPDPFEPVVGGSRHVVRGASWCSRAADARITWRGEAEYPQSDLGFRVALTLGP